MSKLSASKEMLHIKKWALSVMLYVHIQHYRHCPSTKSNPVFQYDVRVWTTAAVPTDDKVRLPNMNKRRDALARKFYPS